MIDFIEQCPIYAFALAVFVFYIAVIAVLLLVAEVICHVVVSDWFQDLLEEYRTYINALFDLIRRR